MKYRLKTSIIFALLVSCLSTFISTSTNAQWLELMADLGFKTTSVNRYLFFSSDIISVRSSLKLFKPAVLRASEFGIEVADASTFVDRTRAAVVVNANFFNEKHAPLGLIMSRGILHQGLKPGSSLLNGVFAFGVTSGSKVFRSERFSSLGITDAVQAGPLLIEGGNATNIRDQRRERRAGVCIDQQERIIIFASSSEVWGVTLSELQELLLGIGCRDALNLDGGGSAQMALSRGLINKLGPGEQDLLIERLEGARGSDQVPVALGLFPSVSSDSLGAGASVTRSKSEE